MVKVFLMIAVMLGLAWFGYNKHKAPEALAVIAPMEINTARASAAARPARASAPVASYQCDGRTHCSQMRSCAEATFFIRHCPGTEMDGDADGVPCERQWCRR
ncbi:MAG: excalibur calcium-binding domain-containing protein [Pseudomonadota bacterium]|nr:excalibur calcium-binding domain-containing protein [Pseudomonadota bacterium]